MLQEILDAQPLLRVCVSSYSEDTEKWPADDAAYVDGGAPPHVFLSITPCRMQNRNPNGSKAGRHSIGIRQREIFLDALDIDVNEERGAFVQLACGKDRKLRRRVEALLTAHGKAGTFLDKPALEGVPRHGLGWKKEPNDGKVMGSAAIGRYKLIRRLGEGGCGIVYLAEQTSPARRQVAIKVIKPGLVSETYIARFKAERRTLALMDHPNIARVLDGGDTEDGRPYLVMELVCGMPVTDYCNENRLVARDRLALFINICHAIQHAHEKGIIHRDIKPSNILVTRRGGASIPKVIDFGIAMVADSRLTDGVVLSAGLQLAGTPAYMSPEQADASGPQVDARTDIYSLGVVLYEMLAGRPPVDSKELIRSGLKGMRRAICATEPLPPSACLQKVLVEKKTRASLRKCMASACLGSVLKGEWDWIVMKAMDKNRRRRYETAATFAAVVQRHLDSQGRQGAASLSDGMRGGGWSREAV